MPLFRRRRPDPPEWADFLDPDGWHEFSEHVRFDSPPSEHGTLVCVPDRHAVLAHPIRDLGAIAAIQNMLQVSQSVFAPPDELVEILNGPK